MLKQPHQPSPAAHRGIVLPRTENQPRPQHSQSPLLPQSHSQRPCPPSTTHGSRQTPASPQSLPEPIAIISTGRRPLRESAASAATASTPRTTSPTLGLDLHATTFPAPAARGCGATATPPVTHAPRASLARFGLRRLGRQGLTVCRAQATASWCRMRVMRATMNGASLPRLETFHLPAQDCR